MSIQAEWERIIRRVIGRYARGSIPAQERRILLPDAQRRERERAARIAAAMERRLGDS